MQVHKEQNKNEQDHIKEMIRQDMPIVKCFSVLIGVPMAFLAVEVSVFNIIRSNETTNKIMNTQRAHVPSISASSLKIDTIKLIKRDSSIVRQKQKH